MHTPGPWKYDEDGTVRAVGLEPGERWIAETSERNGQLIAASPELLTMLTTLTARMRDAFDNGSFSEDVPEMIEQSRALIKRLNDVSV